jgi:hypothetical protein
VICHPALAMPDQVRHDKLNGMLTILSSCHPGLDPGSRAFVQANGMLTILSSCHPGLDPGSRAVKRPRCRIKSGVTSHILLICAA